MSWNLLGVVRGALRGWSNRRAVSRLLEADDAVLADIGLRAVDIRRALREPVFRDPSRALRAACCTWHDARLLSGLPVCCP
jgi:uncharacterized protein YjiS (DUF1127 family)